MSKFVEVVLVVDVASGDREGEGDAAEEKESQEEGEGT